MKIPYAHIYDYKTYTEDEGWYTRRKEYPKVTLKRVGTVGTFVEGVYQHEGTLYQCPVCDEHTVQGWWNIEHDIEYRCSNEECDFADDEMFVIIQGEEE